MKGCLWIPLDPLQLKPILSLPYFSLTLPFLNATSLSPVPLSLHSQEGRETDLGLIDNNLHCNLTLKKKSDQGTSA